MEKMYEVLRFQEYKDQCRQSADCLEGCLLIYYLQEHECIGKVQLFSWFRQLWKSLYDYQRSNRMNYGCLTPYSVLVVGEAGLFLLDPEGEENGFIIKRMQQRAVRNHFIKKDGRQQGREQKSADLYGYGKLMQFLLASVRTEPELTRREAAKCQKVIAGCTGERQRPYERICQVQKDLPEISGQIWLFEKATDLFHGQKKKRSLKISVAVLAVLVFLAGVTVGKGRKSEPENPAVEKNTESRKASDGDTGGGDAKNSERMRTDTAELRMDAEKLEAADREADAAEGADNTEKIEAEDESAAEAAERRFRSYLLSNTRKGNELVMSEGEALERCALWALGTAYERETRVEKAIDVYGRLVEIEENREQIAAAGIRKMKLEAGKEQYSIALLTGKRVLERTGTGPEIEKLMQEYELRIQEQESRVQNGQSQEEQKKEEQKQEGEINEQNVDK